MCENTIYEAFMGPLNHPEWPEILHPVAQETISGTPINISEIQLFWITYYIIYVGYQNMFSGFHLATPSGGINT